MVRLFVRHTVSDYQAWRKVYDEFDAERRPMGVTVPSSRRSTTRTTSPCGTPSTRPRQLEPSPRPSRCRTQWQSAGVQGDPP
jgi:hypothetical protein